MLVPVLYSRRLAYFLIVTGPSGLAMVHVLDFSAYPLGSIAFFSFARPPFCAQGLPARPGGLPFLQLLANWLPKPKEWGGISLQKSWLPLGLFELWMAATAIHLWSIAYVAVIPIQPYLLTPLLWAFAWTIFNRIADYSPNPSPLLRQVLIFAPALAALLGAFQETAWIFFVLTVLNVVIYGVIYAANRKESLAFQLLLLSLVALIAGLPSNLAGAFVPEFNRGRCIIMAVGAFVLVGSLAEGSSHGTSLVAALAEEVPAAVPVGPAAHIDA